MDLNPPWSWWVNPTKSAVTKYENYVFTDIMRIGDVYYGLDPQGALHILDAELDNDDTPIPWEFRTGLDDLGHPGHKGMMAIYIDGLVAGDVELDIHTDTGEVRTYAHVGCTDHRPHRVSIGRGVRTRNFALGMRGQDRFELDELTPEFRFTKRNL